MYDPDKAMQLYVEDDEGCLPETEEEARKQAEADALNPKKEQTTGGGRNWKRKPPPSMTEPQELPLDDKLDSDKIGGDGVYGSFRQMSPEQRAREQQKTADWRAAGAPHGSDGVAWFAAWDAAHPATGGLTPASPGAGEPLPGAGKAPSAWGFRLRWAAKLLGPAAVGAGLGYWFRGHRDKTAQGGF